MKIVNVMFGRGLGGIEQAFLDYNEALALAGHEVLAITHPLAAINPDISGKLTHMTLSNHGSWDFFAAKALKKLYIEWQPDVVFCHGNRAISLNLLAKPSAKLIGITHNYQLRRFPKLHHVIAITHQLKDAAIKAGVAPENISVIPNMVRLPDATLLTQSEPHFPLIIGTMGRMVEKKGFHLLLEAAAILKQRGHHFQIHLGGTGAMDAALRKKAKNFDISEEVRFLGWVADKAAFFNNIDVFCLPSLHEPFGIVLLEAMAHGKAVIGFASEGPSEIIQNQEAVLVENGNVLALAEALTEAVQRPDLLATAAAKGKDLVAREYALPAISKKLSTMLTTIL